MFKKIFFFFVALGFIYLIITQRRTIEPCGVKGDMIFIYKTDFNGVSGKKITSRIPESYRWNFECINDFYARNHNTIFYEGDTLILADYETFEIIPGSPYAKDKNNIYCMGRILKDADRDSFELGANGKAVEYNIWSSLGNPAHDKNRGYSCDIAA